MRIKLKKILILFVCFIFTMAEIGNKSVRLDDTAKAEEKRDIQNVFNSSKIMINDQFITTDNEEINIKQGILWNLYNGENVKKINTISEKNYTGSDTIYSSESCDINTETINYFGTLVAEDNIKINVNNGLLSSTTLFSKNRNILISGKNIDFRGVIYAPNGNVEINCDEFHVEGKIICNELKINVKKLSYDNGNIDKYIEKLQEYKISDNIEINMYYDDNTEKIGIDKINAQKIDLYLRYGDEDFVQIKDFTNGQMFELPSQDNYIEAYVKIIDEYGEDKISNIQTFYRDINNNVYEVDRDADKNGIPDGYEIRKEKDELSLFGSSKTLNEKLLIEKKYCEALRKRCGNFIDMEFSNLDNGTELNYVKYKVKMGDNINIFYDEEGKKHITVYNIINNKIVLDMIDNTYSAFFYNCKGNLIAKMAYDGSNYACNIYYYKNNMINKINCNNTYYTIDYDNLNNIKSISINDQKIEDTKWISKTKCVKKLANGYRYEIDYNKVGKIKKIKDNTGVLYKCVYDKNQHYQVKEIIDNINNIKTEYSYGKNSAQMKCNSSEWKYNYYNVGKKRILKFGINKLIKSECFGIEDDKSIYSSDNVIEQKDDEVNQLTYQGNTIINKKYIDKNSTKKSICINGENFDYYYTEKGLLKEIRKNNIPIARYLYNNLDELVREDSKEIDKSFVYCYDQGGNIIETKEYPLSFDDTLENEIQNDKYQYKESWRDQLTSYNESKILYDLNGNITKNWNGNKLSWYKGDRLKKIITDNDKMEFSYDISGKRIKKRVNEETIKYFYVGDKLMLELRGDKVIKYHYNSYDELVYFEINEQKFFYLLDEQNNVIGLLDEKGNKVVSYVYNSWGEIISCKGDKSVAEINPFRYKSYYYDTESGLYYLYNRYYDPVLKRMISKDKYLDTKFNFFSHNMYAYCENSPVNATNYSGNIPSWVTKLNSSKSGNNYYWKGVDIYDGANCYGYAVYNLEYADPGRWSYRAFEKKIRNTS